MKNTWSHPRNRSNYLLQSKNITNPDKISHGNSTNSQTSDSGQIPRHLWVFQASGQPGTEVDFPAIGANKHKSELQLLHTSSGRYFPLQDDNGDDANHNPQYIAGKT